MLSFKRIFISWLNCFFFLLFKLKNMIEVSNLTANSVDENFLKKIAKKVLIGENKQEVELSIVLLGSGKMKELNRKYRQKNRATDVLSFSYNGSGEIVVCLPQVRKNAKEFHSVFEKELARVLIHGILHLLGCDHEKSRKKAEEMQEKEEYYLRQLKSEL